MEFWDEQAAPHILSAVKSACDGIRAELETEFQTRDRDRHAFLTEEVARLKHVADKAQRLESENHQLRRDLDKLRADAAERPPHICTPSITGPGGTGVSRSGSTEPVLDDSVLPNRQAIGETTPHGSTATETTIRELHDYATLAKEYALLLKRYTNKQEAARRLKERSKQWIKYAESKDTKIRKLEKRLHVLGASRELDNDATGNPPAFAENEFDNTASDTSFRSVSEVHITEPPPQSDAGDAEPILEASPAAPEPGPPEPQADSSDTEREGTEAPDDDDLALPPLPRTPSPVPVVIKPEPLTDDPIIVAEKVVRKRRRGNEDGGEAMPPPRTRIKKEMTNPSSDPVFTEGHVAFLPHESLDLDEGHDGLPTPRKQRFLGVEAFQSVAVGEDIGHVMGHGTDAEGGLAPETSNMATAASNMTPTTSNMASATSNMEPATSNMASRQTEQPGMSAAQVPEAAPNARIEHGFAAVAEDDGSFIQPPPPKQPPAAQPAENAGSGRLKNLMGKKAPEAVPVLSSEALQMKRNLARPDTADTTLDLMALRPENKTRRSPLTVIQAHLTKKPNQPAPAPAPKAKADGGPPKKKPGRLRLLPLEKLRLEDFKINPKLNNGHTHAFHDVVRDRAGRAELAGCVDPKCCGKQFQAMARSELDHGGLAIMSRDADVALMEEFLGDDGYQLMGMPLDQKKGIWLQARTRDLANRYGRCRHRVARRPSPPGYWNPDFPSTQEGKENREEAERIEMRMVEERWREAKRDGGRWLFRDE